MIKQEVIGIASEFWNKVVEDVKANPNKETNYKTTKKQNEHFRVNGRNRKYGH